MSFEKKMKKRGMQKLDALVKNPYQNQKEEEIKKPFPLWAKIVIPVASVSFASILAFAIIVPSILPGLSNTSMDMGQGGGSSGEVAPSEPYGSEDAAISYYYIDVKYEENQSSLLAYQGDIDNNQNFTLREGAKAINALNITGSFNEPLLPGDVVSISGLDYHGSFIYRADTIKIKAKYQDSKISWICEVLDENNREYEIKTSHEFNNNHDIPYLLNNDNNPVSFTTLVDGQEAYAVYRQDQLQNSGDKIIYNALAIYTSNRR